MGTRTAARSKAKAKREARYQRALRKRAAGERSPIELAVEICQAPGVSGPLNAADCTLPAAGCGESPGECSSLKQVAAAALILGQNVTKTAAALGVDRRTVQRWGKSDPEFHEALSETKREVVVISRQSLLALAESAVEMVETKLTVEKNPRIALAFLRGIGVLTPEALAPPDQAQMAPVPPALVPAADVKPDSENENRAQSATFDSATAGDSLDQTAAQTISPAADSGAEEETVYELADLLPAQQRAVGGLFAGKSIAAVAHLTQSSQETIRNWLCHDVGFFTVISELQFGRIVHLKHRLLKLLEFAMEIVRQGIAAGDGRLALALVRGLGLMR
jgi:hypothetical protein